MKFWTHASVAIILTLAGPVGWIATDACRGLQAAEPTADSHSFILQGAPVAEMAKAVAEVGGSVSYEAPISDSVAARLSFSQLTRISDINPDIRALEDGRESLQPARNLQTGATDFCLTAERTGRGGAGFSSLSETRGLSAERSLAMQLGLTR